jgi:molybdopterin-guanine dinucleotide biosynthesis protein A
MAAAARSLVAGVFVGGASSRMGGVAKGLLPAPGGGTLLDRWLTLLAGAGIPAVLVGRHPAYAAHAGRIETLADDPPGIGPLGGLSALLQRADGGYALALACDMPFVSADLVDRLRAAPAAPVVAPRREGRWEPLCARYDARAVLPVVLRRAAGEHHGLQGLLDEVGAVELAVADAASELKDWDTPDDC